MIGISPFSSSILLFGQSGGTPVDPDAQAFITAAAITDPTQQSAVNQLVVDLKGYGVWSKMKAIYPFVGGTASTHKFNLKNPLDTDAAFRLVFNGGWTHSANGALPNGTNGFANTFLTPSTAYSTNNSAHLSIYSRTNTILDSVDMGGLNGSARTDLSLRVTDGNIYARVHLNGVITANTNSQGYYVINRNSSTSLKLFKNNIQLGSTYTGTNGNRLDTEIYIGAYHFGTGSAFFSNRQYAFASIGDGLTDTESANLYTAVQTFQTTLGREIGNRLLDNYSGAGAAYSVRRLSSTYTSALIRVRRSSDNTEQDISYDSNGNLNETALLAFVGAGNGFVTKWYDQSGNARDIVQSTAANQPQIVNNGVVLTRGTKPCMRFDGINDEITSTLLSGFARTDQYYVAQTSDTTYLYPNHSGTAYGFVANSGDNSTNIYNAYGTPSLYVNNSLFTGTTRNQVYNILNGYKSILHQNGTSMQTYNFGNYTGYAFAGDLQEFIYYVSDMSASRNGIFSNINSYYSIY